MNQGSHGAPDRLPALAARLADLDGSPLDGHPDVLEELHRELVSELDGLALGGPSPAAAGG